MATAFRGIVEFRFIFLPLMTESTNGLRHVSDKDSLRALQAATRSVRVDQVADPDCFTTAPSAPLDDVFQQMNAQNCSTVPVVEAGQLVGLLTLENVGELIMVSSALGARSHPGVKRERLSEVPLRERPDGTASSPGSASVP